MRVSSVKSHQETMWKLAGQLPIPTGIILSNQQRWPPIQICKLVNGDMHFHRHVQLYDIFGIHECIHSYISKLIQTENGTKDETMVHLCELLKVKNETRTKQETRQKVKHLEQSLKNSMHRHLIPNVHDSYSKSPLWRYISSLREKVFFWLLPN